MGNHILVIDYDEAILDLFIAILTDEGYEVTALKDAVDILAIIESSNPDLVIIDYLLSGINGGEMCAQIKRETTTLHLPVLLTSAHARVFLSLGTYNCDEFLEKPFDINYLKERVRSHLKKEKQKTRIV
jgi:DNA-binding response OmpR family regulator